MRKLLLFICLLPFWITLQAQQMPDLVNEVSLDSLIKTVREFSGEDSARIDSVTVRIKHRVSSRGNDLSAAYLVAKLKAFGLTVIEDNYRSGGKNIIAIKEGKVNPDNIYMMGAHYDAVADYCADDNASGSASVLECARIMSRRCFENTFIFAFWDEEERGLIGSSNYAKSAAARGDNILGMLNNDMLAYDSDSDHVFDIHADTAAYNLRMKDTLLYVLDTLGLDLTPQLFIPGTTRSDHASFWRNGYPAVFFGESFLGGDPNPHYHRSTDRINLFNLEYYHELVKLGVGTMVQLAGIIPTSIQHDTITSCDSFMHRDSMYTSSTFIRDTLKTVQGCDSIYTIDLTIHQSVVVSDSITACNSYSYNGEILRSSGDYSYDYSTADGCDSIYQLHLEIIDLSDSVIVDGRRLIAYDSTASYQWLECADHFILTGDTNQTFEVISDGAFAVEVSKGQCIDTSNCIQMLISSTNGSLFSKVLVYPNPNDGLIFIELPQRTEFVHVKLYSIQGVLVHSERIMWQTELQVAVPDLHGWYYLKLETEDFNWVQPVIIK